MSDPLTWRRSWVQVPSETYVWIIVYNVFVILGLKKKEKKRN